MRLLVLVPLVASLAAATPANAATQWAKRIATASDTGFRVDVVARRAGSGRAPTAAITIVTYRRTNTAWKRLAATPLRGTFFWKTVAGPRAVCRLSLTTAGTARVVVQLLTSPSIGCGPTHTIELRGG